MIPGLLGVPRRRRGRHDLIKLVVFHAIRSARPVFLLTSRPFLRRLGMRLAWGCRLGRGATPKVEDDAGTDTLHDPAVRLLRVLWFLLLIFGNRLSLLSEARCVSLQETLGQECAGLQLPLTVVGCVPRHRQLGIRGRGPSHASLKGVVGRDAGGRHETKGVLMVCSSCYIRLGGEDYLDRRCTSPHLV